MGALKCGAGAPGAQSPCGRPFHPGGYRGARHPGVEHDARHPKRAVLHGPGLEREVCGLKFGSGLGLGLGLGVCGANVSEARLSVGFVAMMLLLSEPSPLCLDQWLQVL